VRVFGQSVVYVSRTGRPIATISSAVVISQRSKFRQPGGRVPHSECGVMKRRHTG
jgi:hypothetical protein